MVFKLDRWRLALPLEAVERVVEAVEITPLPGAPAVVTGIVDVRGRVLPVVDLRRPFGDAPQALRLSDRLLIAHSGSRELVLVASEVEGVRLIPAGTVVTAGAVAPCSGSVHGIVRDDSGLVLIQDLGALLTLEDERRLDEALAALAEAAGDDR